MANKNESLDAILADFEHELENRDTLGFDERAAITIWIPKCYEEKYKAIQEKTRKMFSKKLRQVVMTSIDKVDQAG